MVISTIHSILSPSRMLKNLLFHSLLFHLSSVQFYTVSWNHFFFPREQQFKIFLQFLNFFQLPSTSRARCSEDTYHSTAVVCLSRNNTMQIKQYLKFNLPFTFAIGLLVYVFVLFGFLSCLICALEMCPSNPRHPEKLNINISE